MFCDVLIRKDTFTANKVAGLSMAGRLPLIVSSIYMKNVFYSAEVAIENTKIFIFRLEVT